MPELEREPTCLIAGDSVAWRRELADYPATGGWAVAYALRGPDSLDLAATADGDAHVVELTAAASGALAAGRYLVAGFATLGAERATFYQGELELSPNPASLAAGHDPRTHARRVLEAIEAVLEQRATRDQASFTLNGRALERWPIADLLAFRDRYRREVAGEEAAARLAAGLGNPRRTIRTRFGRGY
ncbi:MAG: hypothetical protein DCC71_15485 [Proteobacteria bacterium]|nr:MAG: hypothetical protein DCC71_15485 [Pseudomonadota bacterium]